MFYKFNTLTQNLVATTQDDAVGRPITPQAFATTVKESPGIHYEYKTLRPAPSSLESGEGLHHEAGKYQVPITKGYRQLMKLQTLFLSHDGKLVWQKVPADKALYFFAAGLAVVGAGVSLNVLKKLISPPKNE
uniref:Uncharacterized protein n=1 Tax=Arion vulgaris TaxID=1028688 RepID=A0A0B6YRW6_9EUPU